ncbi:uncharacterized protein LOC142635090 [Castanea sativa]|uniref:uncharacterized protein LOC142635090 n=1 Tax=Castanea sativa TaxID=21020 RepID=UPI003F64D63D
MIVLEKSLRLSFSATKNEAKYEALLVVMAMVQKVGEKIVEMFSDSRLVVGQVEGELKARDPRMQEYLNQVRHLQSKFESFTLVQVPKSKNTHADSLATLVTSLAQSLPQVILVEDLCKPIEMKGDMVQVHQIRAGPSCMDSIVLFLKEYILLKEKSKMDKVCRKALRFWLSEDQKLYKHSFSRPYLLCIHPKATKLLLKELHEGICGSHTRGLEFLIPSSQTMAFSLILRPLEDIAAICITNKYSTPAYPRGNEQAEAINKVIVNGLKKRLVDAKGKWVEELLHVLWTYRTTPHRSIGETPFSMTYGVEAIIPLKTSFPTLRTSSFTLSNNDELLERGLDLVEERRKNAIVQLA